MKQIFHSNAKTNIHIREQIQTLKLANNEISERFDISMNTVIKWKYRLELEDKSSRPNLIHYSLNEIERALIVQIRRTTWLPLDEIHEMMVSMNPEVSRSSVYRTFKREGISTVPEKARHNTKKFKEYIPGFLHIDVTYLPKINGVRYYLYVAIDRATRLMYYQVYTAKTSENTEVFMEECISFFPFELTHVLTDNGLEFTNKLITSKKGNKCLKPSKLDVICEKENIDHRLTRPGTPQTNGMVERVNGTIKKGTILKNKYNDINELKFDLMTFLMHYNLYRRHGGLRKELGVKTPFLAVIKWKEMDPEIFKQTLVQFEEKLYKLNPDYLMNAS